MLFLREQDGEALLATEGLRRSLDDGTFWFFQAMDNPVNPRILCNLFQQHIEPGFAGCLDGIDRESFEANPVASSPEQSSDFGSGKLSDKALYETEIRRTFRDLLANQ